MLGHVRDLGLNAEKDPTARVYQTHERQTYHTDSCDVVGLLCLKTAKSGGASALVSSMTIYNEMRKRRPDLLVGLFEPLHTDRRGEVPAGQKAWHDIPVYNWHEGRLSALYTRRYIESARRFPEVPALTARQVEALDLFDALAEDPAITLQMTFRPGDMQWVHNHTMLHDRTAFEDWPEPERSAICCGCGSPCPAHGNCRQSMPNVSARSTSATAAASWCRAPPSMRRSKRSEAKAFLFTAEIAPCPSCPSTRSTPSATPSRTSVRKPTCSSAATTIR